jgi:coproporphyrinogen III oxidase-like Fe-S oxidoreductase
VVFPLIEEILIMLSNLGAVEEDRAVTKDALNQSEKLRGKSIDEDVKRLIETGYVKDHNGRLYLTKAGLFRALSRFS